MDLFKTFRFDIEYLKFIVFQKILFYFESICYHISNPNESIMK